MTYVCVRCHDRRVNDHDFDQWVICGLCRKIRRRAAQIRTGKRLREESCRKTKPDAIGPGESLEEPSPDQPVSLLCKE